MPMISLLSQVLISTRNYLLLHKTGLKPWVISTHCPSWGTLTDLNRNRFEIKTFSDSVGQRKRHLYRPPAESLQNLRNCRCFEPAQFNIHHQVWT